MGSVQYHNMDCGDDLHQSLDINDKTTQCNRQMSFTEIMIQLYYLCRSYFCRHSNEHDLPSPITCTSMMNTAAIGDLRQSKQFDNVRLWMTALPLHFYIPQHLDIECHWDRGSNSNIFTKKEYFFCVATY